MKSILKFLNVKSRRTQKHNAIRKDSSRSYKTWLYYETAIIINAVEFCAENGLDVNINLLAPYLHRSDSSIRNMILEYAGKLQHFRLGTTNKPYKKDQTESFLQFVLDPNRKQELIAIFKRLCIFESGTPAIILSNFWIFNQKGELIWHI